MIDPARSTGGPAFTFVEGWADRPSYRGPGEDEHSAGSFRGRAPELGQLQSFFLQGAAGTVLVSGPRGVGKTATIDLALIKTVEAINRTNAANGTQRRRLLGILARTPLSTVSLHQLRPKELIV